MADQPDTLPNEEWLDVPGLEGLYQASSEGRIKRLARWVPARSGGSRFWDEAIITGHKTRRGYVNIKVKGRSVEAHRMVCAAFHGPPPTPKHHAAHANDVKDDNRATNLRWATAKENAQDRKANGLQVCGESVAAGKLTEDQVRSIRARHTGAYGDTIALAREFGVRSENIIAIVKRRSWQHID
jgi:uncharacterized NAD(P)/FAD-binding protein YdhS